MLADLKTSRTLEKLTLRLNPNTCARRRLDLVGMTALRHVFLSMVHMEPGMTLPAGCRLWLFHPESLADTPAVAQRATSLWTDFHACEWDLESFVWPRDAFLCPNLSMLVLTTASMLMHLEQGSEVFAHIPKVVIRSERAVRLTIPTASWRSLVIEATGTAHLTFADAEAFVRVARRFRF